MSISSSSGLRSRTSIRSRFSIAISDRFILPSMSWTLSGVLLSVSAILTASVQPTPPTVTTPSRSFALFRLSNRPGLDWLGLIMTSERLRMAAMRITLMIRVFA